MNKKKELLFSPIDKNKLKLIKIDEESTHYITPYIIANKITYVIISYLYDLNCNPNNCTIIDCMAGVGGNTLSFCKFFEKVISIEINKLRFEYLMNNVNIYEFNNVTGYNDDFLNIIFDSKFKPDVIFLDPPWGGVDYKLQYKVKINIDNFTLEELCNKIIEINNPKLIVVKLPKNYDLYFFYKNIYNRSIILHEFKKMNILILR